MVYFVGAGSGAVDLITVRGARLLSEADVIIYAGSLVNPELLSYAKISCSVHDSAYMTLENVMKVIRQAEENGKMVVRLHTGDTSIFSAIREQMDALTEDGIPYQIVPGVSSFCGAAAALQAEYTLPGVTQTVIISRMAGRTPVPEREQIRNLAKIGSTMVLFLSSSLIPQLVEELLEGGVYTENTPAAIVYKATWPEEKVFHCTLSTLDQTARDNHISKTALITVGDFLNSGYERSKLYDPSFSTEFRQASYGD
jgi:precorrin-4/cobalt-precorrin-4 C11-methyltransferase